MKKSELRQLIREEIRLLKESTWTRYAETNEQEQAIKKIEGWVKKCGRQIVGGTTIGKHPQTVILDLTYQGSQIYINSNGFGPVYVGSHEFPGVKVNGKEVGENDFNKFKELVNGIFKTKGSEYEKRDSGD